MIAPRPARRFRFQVPKVLVIAFASTAVVSSPTEARTLIVDAALGPYFEIQPALDKSADGDTVLVLPGMYLGNLDTSVSVHIEGRDGAAATIIDGRGWARGLVNSGASISLRGLTFRHCAAQYGGAIRVFQGRLDAESCTFEENEAEAASAIHVVGSDLFLNRCTFRANRSTHTSDGSILHSSPWPPTPEGEAATRSGIIEACSFLQLERVRGAAMVGFRSSDVLRSLFWGEGVSTAELFRNRSPRLSRCVFWNRPSPWLVPDAPLESEDPADGLAVVDPRFCGGSDERVHASSPLLAIPDLPIGNVSLGCSIPILHAVLTEKVDATAFQFVQVVAYGLSPEARVELEDLSGTRYSGALTRDLSTHLTYRFDLTGAQYGPASVVVVDGDHHFRLDGVIEVAGLEVFGVLPNWQPDGGPLTAILAGRRIESLVGAHLEHEGSGVPYPLVLDRESIRTVLGRKPAQSVVRPAVVESLDVSCDLEGAPDGVYDLHWSTSTHSGLVEAAFQIGDRPIVRVPEEVSDLNDALAAAAPGAEIRVSGGTYVGPFIIDKPVRLVGLGSDYTRPTLDGSGTGQRVLQVTESAGPLTEIVGFRIQGGNVQDGPGGGVWAEPAILLRDNWIVNNKCSGADALGGGVYSVSGLRAVNNRFYVNSASGHWGDMSDPFDAPTTEGGIGGGVYCLGCWIEGSEFLGNRGERSAGLVAEGVILRNQVSSNDAAGSFYSDVWRATSATLRGLIVENEIDHHCAPGYPVAAIEGPSVASRNVLRACGGGMCWADQTYGLHGEVEFRGNAVQTSSSLVVDANGPPEAAGRGVVVRENGVSGVAVLPVGYEYMRYVIKRPYAEEALPVDVCCNFDTDDYPCPPPSPVIVNDVTLRWVQHGVALGFRLLADIDVTGWHIWRRCDDSELRLTATAELPCTECSFVDATPGDGSCEYTVELMLPDGSSERHVLGSVESSSSAPADDGLRLRSRNPANGIVAFTVGLSAPSERVSVVIFDVLGRQVDRVELGLRGAGWHEAQWGGTSERGRRVPSGMYVARLEGAKRDATVCFLLLSP